MYIQVSQTLFSKSTDYCPFNIIRLSKINKVLYLSMIETIEPVSNISSLVIIYNFFSNFF
jgi:hypothetical protein